MKITIRQIYLFALFFLLCGALPISLAAQSKSSTKQAARITIQGQVLDSITGEPLDFVNIAEKGTTNGTITNTKGDFSMLARPGSTIQFSYLGYNTKTITAGNRRMNVTIKMLSQDVQLSEVVVKPKRQRYRRKDNPAVILIRNVIAHKEDHSPKSNEYFSETRYDNMTYSLNNFSGSHLELWKKKFKFIENYVDTALVTGTPVLPVSTDERVEKHYFRKDGGLNRTVTEAEQHAGLDDMLPEQVTALLKTEVFPEMDLNEDNIYLYRKKFVSPISSFGPTFYHYYILDTLKLEDGLDYIDLGFAPAMPQSFGFVGHLYVSLDSTYWVKRAELNIPPDINLNFVRNLHVEFENGRLEDSTRVVLGKSFYSELNVTSGSMGLYAQRMIRYNDFSKSPLEKSIFDAAPKRDAPELESNSTNLAYWESHRPKWGYDPERSVGAMITEMRRVPLYKYGEKVLTYLFKGFVPIDEKVEEKAKFLYGPINCTASWNSLEHMRFRVGGITTANLNHHLFGSGYVVYALNDHKWKYDAALEYSFRRKKNFANEFPIHSLKFESTYDSKELGLVLETNRDNFVTSFRRTDDPKFIYVRSNSLLYTLEFWNHFSIKLKGDLRREYQTRLGKFELSGTGIEQDYYDLAMATASLRWAPKEAFAQNKTSRVRVDHRHPVFELTHKMAHSGFMGTDFDYQATEFSFEKRFWLNVLGHATVNIDLGKIWTGDTPYPLLYMPNANTGYTIQLGAFSQLQSMEFVYDQYAHWNVAWRMLGLIFNNIPYVRHLKWREVVTFRGVYGKLSEKNDPDALNADGTLMNPNLYKLPSNGTVYRLGDTPYMEVAFGLENIFKVIRIEYIRRLTYLDHPGIRKNGAQATIVFSF
jgi:hypothetical protein